MGNAGTPEKKALKLLRRALDRLVEQDMKGFETVMMDLPRSEDQYLSGYGASLSGIAKAIRSGDRDFLVNRLKQSPNYLENEIKRLRQTAQTHLLSEWDQGYFDAWLAYLTEVKRTSRYPTVEEQAVDQSPEE